MLAPQQIAANRRNSLKSTGPRTTEGKFASSHNALKSGINSATLILPDESPDEYATIAAAWHRQYPDATPLESAYLDALIANRWFLRRLMRIESGLLAQEQAGEVSSDLPLGHSTRSRLYRAAATRNDQFHRLDTRRRQILGVVIRAQNELGKLRANPASCPATPGQSQQNTAAHLDGSVFSDAAFGPESEATLRQ